MRRNLYRKGSVRDVRRKAKLALYAHTVPDSIKASAYLSRGLPVPTRMCPESCELCGAQTSRMCLDHCHDTGEFRGWLCTRCNTAIGSLGDNEMGLQKAIRYLKN